MAITSPASYSAWVDRDEILIKYKFDKDYVNDCRAIRSRRWDGTLNHFSVNDAHHVRELTRKWGIPISLDIENLPTFNDPLDPVALEATKAQKDNARELYEQSTMLEWPEFEIPGLVKPLHPYQRAGVAYMQRVRRCILGDQMGLGKTTQAISTVVLDQSLPVVIASKNRLKETIREDILSFYPNLKISVVNGGALKDIPKSDVIIVNYDIVSQRLPDIFNHGFNSLIVDESHYIKNGKRISRCPICSNKLRAINSVNCPSCGARGIKPKSRWSVRRTDAVMQLAHSLPDNNLIMLLTGTAINIRPGELVRQLECINRLKVFGGEWKFRQRYCPDNKTAQNLKELNTKLRENCYVRRRTRDVYGQLPPVQNSIQRMILSKEQRARYKEIEDDVVHYLSNKARQRAIDVGEHGHTAYWNKRRAVERAEALIRVNVLRSVIAEIKMEAMQDWINNFLESGDEKMVVFANKISVVDGIYEAHRDVAVKVRGDVTNKDALAATHSFQEEDWCRMWVANLQSGKEGFTLTESKHVVFCEPEWSPTYHAQGVGRVYGRANNPHGATAYWLLAEDTIDFDMYELLQERQVVIDAVLDGEEDTAEQESMQNALIELLEKRN